MEPSISNSGNRVSTNDELARVVTGALAGAAVAPPQERRLGAVLGATVAVDAAYLTFGLRKRAMRSSGQTFTGVIEDAIATSAALWVGYIEQSKHGG